MIEEAVRAFFGGVALSLSVSSPVEWAVHRYLLHPKKINFLNEKSERGHARIHHKAYSTKNGAAHYYRDITNEHAVIHFSLGDVGLIHGISAAVGLGIDRAYAYLSEKNDFSVNDGAFIGGVVGGSCIYYLAYEISHHYMHVIGKRRKTINEVLGNSLQSTPDGQLRFSKPLLDDICSDVEWHVDRNVGKRQATYSFDSALIERFEQQAEYNRAQGVINVPVSAQETLDKVTNDMVEREENLRASFGIFKKRLYWIDRKIQKQLRSSPVFQYLDNHHFIHHYQWLNNLNVVFPLADCVLGTNVDSSRKFLDDNKLYWLCPNSPDTIPFPIPELV